MQHIARKLLTGDGKIKYFGLMLGLFSLVFLQLLPPPLTIDAYSWGVLSVMALMIIWWITEAVPLPVTGLIPIALFPLLDIVPMEKVTASYANPLIYLFLGGFLLAAALERWNLHKRIALTIVCWVGTSGQRIIGGFMVATAFLSMWISNTATTVMMLPIVLSVVRLFLEDERIKGARKDKERFTTALILCVPYAASIGGMATLIGTPPNAILAGFLQKEYGITLDFARWMMIGLPVMVTILFCSWWLLSKTLFRYQLPHSEEVAGMIRFELDALGDMRWQEKMVGAVFAMTACLWIMRPLLNDALETAGLPAQLSDPGIAIFMAILLFAIPTSVQKEEFLLDWKTAHGITWGTLFLFGGGLALASALTGTRFVADLSDFLVQGDTSTFILMASAVVMMLLLTELMSNMALTALLLPVVGAVAIDLGASPLLLAIPVTLASSCAFMMPVATPPNSIVFASGAVRISHMVYAGFFLNIISILLILAFSWWWVRPVLGV